MKPYLLLTSALLSAAVAHSFEVRQITFDNRNHDLDNNQNFSRDGEWLIYDTRNPGIGEGRTLEKVHIDTGEVRIIYSPPFIENQGPGVGATSLSPKNDRVVFIHGPWKETGHPYDFTWRRGGLIDFDGKGPFAFADARDITPPYTVGALRGGTHRHEWDGTGQWLGFTYNDEIMKNQGIDLRTIGVTKLGQPVEVKNSDPMKYEGDGEGFSALVVHVVPNPKPGSDEVSRAASDSWVGLKGYKKADGSMQRARAFIGKTVSKSGEEVDEVFIVDIPEDLNQPGELGPLEGADSAYPAPPKGASQRRLTWTDKWKTPGAIGTCWTSPDGAWITFLAHDDEGLQQIFTISPLGGDPVQLTAIPGGVADSPRWSPDGKGLVSVAKDGRLFCLESPGGDDPGGIREPVWLTKEKDTTTTKVVWSTQGDRIAFNRQVTNENGTAMQIFVVGAPRDF
ncbi:MAG: DUF3748 domain-containing protein [Candidatus Omnitrophica bacterium]|nr:DUF3748 domain-containing protein [Candidatus Omnitrophota bacterium]MCA9423841.1 DUF3748 domain-containing protein [Candidatus Omnitrophota bacterium]